MKKPANGITKMSNDGQLLGLRQHDRVRRGKKHLYKPIRLITCCFSTFDGAKTKPHSEFGARGASAKQGRNTTTQEQQTNK
jgi:hypothetical protein